MTTQIDLLGYPVRDVVTGFSGVVSSVSFDLFGCIQAAITPPHISGQDIKVSLWFDTCRLVVTGARVMEPPDFNSSKQARVDTAQSGCAEKPNK